jgi:nucleoside-diphosphate-sugar epimerase
MTTVLITGAAGNAGQAVAREVAATGFDLRLADAVSPPPEVLTLGEFVRVDTRTATDVRDAVEGVDAVIHLAAWHSAHRPPVSDATIFAVYVDGTFNVLEACRRYGVQSLVFASSMAYGWGNVYAATKVLGEELCRSFHEMTGAAVAMLRYHEFIPARYLDYGPKLLRNGVDRADVARATLAALQGTLEHKVDLFMTIVHTVDLFMTIVHTDHGMPSEVVADFRTLGPDWLEAKVPGAKRLIEKYHLPLPEKVEQHDLSEAERLLGWRPQVGFVEFLQDLAARDARGDDVQSLWVPGALLVLD